MDYKEKLISLINDKTLPIEQRKKLEEIYNNVVESEEQSEEEFEIIIGWHGDKKITIVFK